MNKEPHRILSVAYFVVFVEPIGTNGPLVDERKKVQMPLGINKMNSGRRSERQISILGCRIIRSNKTGEQYCDVQRQQEHQRSEELWPVSHAEPSLIRGSTATSRISARMLPRIMKSVDAITVPITT